MSVDLLGIHIRDMPNMLHYFAITMHDDLTSVLKSPSFQLYDVPLEKMLRAMVKSLGMTLSYDRHYRELNNQWIQAFGQRGSHVDRDAEIAAARDIEKHIYLLSKSLGRVIKFVRSNYIEIDFDNTSRQFGENYNKMINSVNH